MFSGGRFSKRRESPLVVRTVLTDTRYLFVDHERGDFKIAQAVMPDTTVSPDLVEVKPVAMTKEGLSTATQAGIGVAIGIFVSLLAIAVWFWWRKKQKKLNQERDALTDDTEPYVRVKSELDGTSRDMTIMKPELAAGEATEGHHDFAKADVAEADSSVLSSGSKHRSATLVEADSSVLSSDSRDRSAALVEADAGPHDRAELPEARELERGEWASRRDQDLHELP
jgi:hypothetical protein